jgi:hypothetical protein
MHVHRWVALLAWCGCQSEPEPPVDTDTPDVVGALPPTGGEVEIDPVVPEVGEALRAELIVPSVDPDGDEVVYRYAWTVDGSDAAVDGPGVPAGRTGAAQRWTVVVTPSDGLHEGASFEASVVVGNRAPVAPPLAFSTTYADERLDLVFEEPLDPEGDPLERSLTWYQDGAENPELKNRLGLDASRAVYGRTYRVVLSVSDPYHPASTSEATVTLGYDCDHLPRSAPFEQSLGDARGYHGLAIDDAGALVGWNGSGVTKSFYNNGFELWFPYSSTIQQIDRHPNGSILLADADGRRILQVDATGNYVPVSGDIGYVYGLTVGPDGKVWTADQGVRRTDITTGETEVIVPISWGNTAHSLAFNLDSTVLYIGTIGGGVVWALSLDEDLNPVGRPTEYVTGLGGWHDGLELDVCGNLYVADYSTSSLYRVEPDGTVTSMVPQVSSQYGHGTTWGTGVGGWRDDAIYQPQPYDRNHVREVVVGLPGADTVRTWNGVAVPW